MEKVKRVLNFASELLKVNFCVIRRFAQFVGLLVSSCPAVKYGRLYRKNFERQKYLAPKRSHQNVNAKMPVSTDMKVDLLWWIKNIHSAYNDIRSQEYQLVIFTDSSKTGWGAVCGLKKAQGLWSESEQARHINFKSFRSLKQFYLAYNVLLGILPRFQFCYESVT